MLISNLVANFPAAHVEFVIKRCILAGESFSSKDDIFADLFRDTRMAEVDELCSALMDNPEGKLSAVTNMEASIVVKNLNRLRKFNSTSLVALCKDVLEIEDGSMSVSTALTLAPYMYLPEFKLTLNELVALKMDRVSANVITSDLPRLLAAANVILNQKVKEGKL